MTGDTAADLGRHISAEAAASGQRRLLWLAGDRHWCRALAAQVLEAGDSEPTLWIAARAPDGAWRVPGNRCHQVLGREVHALVFDAWDGFDPDAFGAASGTLAGGGLLLLLSPAPENWPRFQDPEHARIATAPVGPEGVTGRYLRRLVARLQHDPRLYQLQQGRQPQPGTEPARYERPTEVAAATSVAMDRRHCGSRDQVAAVAAVVKVARGQRRRPVVLTADRGRGKSAALGIAAAQLLSAGRCTLAVTGPRLQAVQTVFDHALAKLDPVRSAPGLIDTATGELRFIAPDQLLAAPRPLDLLLVDEAAALPTPLLAALLRQYNRIAFATTVHGYEGSGRGFALRFNRLLDAGTRGWRTQPLHTPIRWAAGDPLEALSFDALMLDAEPAPATAVAALRADDCELQVLDRDRLAGDETTLRELFGLLALSHYRTRPYDLRHLLDGPNLQLLVLRGPAADGRAGPIVGTAVVASEGGFGSEVSEAIWAGRSRPHGHLLPETLAAHLGLQDAPRLRCLRVMRIATHPALRRRGLGTRLLAGVAAVAQSRPDLGLDYLGTSFGADAGLMAFWRQAGYLPVRVSIKPGAASAAHSVLMLKPLSRSGRDLCRLAQRRFFVHLPHQLADHLQGLDPELALDLLQGCCPATELDPQDRLDLSAFTDARRLYEACIGPLYRQALRVLSAPLERSPLAPEQRLLLLRRVVQRQAWDPVARAHGLAGRKAVIAALRQAFRACAGW